MIELFSRRESRRERKTLVLALTFATLIHNRKIDECALHPVASEIASVMMG